MKKMVILVMVCFLFSCVSTGYKYRNQNLINKGISKQRYNSMFNRDMQSCTYWAMKKVGDKSKYYQRGNTGACRMAQSSMSSGGINLSGASCVSSSQGGYGVYYSLVNRLRDRCMYSKHWVLVAE